MQFWREFLFTALDETVPSFQILTRQHGPFQTRAAPLCTRTLHGVLLETSCYLQYFQHWVLNDWLPPLLLCSSWVLEPTAVGSVVIAVCLCLVSLTVVQQAVVQGSSLDVVWYRWTEDTHFSKSEIFWLKPAQEFVFENMFWIWRGKVYLNA